MAQHGFRDRFRNRSRPNLRQDLLLFHLGAEIHIHRLENASHGRGDLGQAVLVERQLGVALNALRDVANLRLGHLDSDEAGRIRGGHPHLRAFAGL